MVSYPDSGTITENQKHYPMISLRRIQIQGKLHRMGKPETACKKVMSLTFFRLRVHCRGMGRIADETLQGAKWGVIQKATLQPVQFLFSIILARLITPDEMGILGLTSIFFVFASQLQSCGFGAALIRKQDRTDEDICTAFWFNVGMSAILATCIFAAAPWFAWFYNQPALLNLTRVSAVMMFLSSTCSVHYSLYSARRDFRTGAIIAMVCALVPMPFTIWAAFCGWSYWSLMVQSVMANLLSLSIIWIISPWKPSFKWSNQSFREFFGFGFKMTLSNLLSSLYTESRTFIIGKFYSPAQLAYFSKGTSLCQTPINLTVNLLSGITYPILSTLQDQPDRLISVYRKYIRLTSLVVEWIMLTLAFNSHNSILLLFGENWLQAAFYVQILCYGFMFNPLSSINANLYAVLGRTDVMLKRVAIMRVYGILVMLGGATISVEWVCYAAVSCAILTLLLALYFTSQISPLTARMQLADFCPYLLMGLVANIPSYFIDKADWHPFLGVCAGGGCSALIYITLLVLSRDSAGAYLLYLACNKKPLSFFVKKPLTPPQW